MWRVLACAAVSVVLGCGAGAECEAIREVAAPSSGTEPGTLWSATVQSQARDQRSYTGAIAVRSDGSVLCVACAGIVELDAQQRPLGVHHTTGPTGVAVAPDDAFYAIMRGPGVGAAELVAMSPAGTPRWSAILDAPSNLVKVVATSDVAYVGAEWEIHAFDAATGAQRTLATGHRLLDVSRDRMFTLEPHSDGSATLHGLDLSGNAVWSRGIASTFYPFDIAEAVATPDGGLIVFGSTGSTLDFGDRTLPITSSPTSFVAAFNASGATDWLFTTGREAAHHIALTAHGEISLASEWQLDASLFSPEIDSYVSVATSDGIVRTHTIGGRGIQSIVDLAVAPDGLVWVQVDSSPSGDDYPDPVLQIGEHSFEGEGAYVLKLVP